MMNHLCLIPVTYIWCLEQSWDWPTSSIGFAVMRRKRVRPIGVLRSSAAETVQAKRAYVIPYATLLPMQHSSPNVPVY